MKEDMSNYYDDEYSMIEVLSNVGSAMQYEDADLCPQCKGSGLDRNLYSDCMMCWGEGTILREA